MIRRTTFSLAIMLFAWLLIIACSNDEPTSSTGASPAPTDSASDANTRVPETPSTTRESTSEPNPTQTSEDAGTTGQAECPSPDVSTGLSTETLQSGDLDRSYRLYVPTSYDASEPLPLLLNFHGLSSNAEEQELYSGFADLAEEEGFILVTPNGTGTFIQEWHVLGPWEPGYVDDVAFVDNLIDHLGGRLCIDQDHIYAAGISNGGAMASLLGCNLDRITAIATVAGAPYSNYRCEREHPVAVIAFHGTGDPLIPFSFSEYLTALLPLSDVKEDMTAWATSNGCDLTLNTESIAEDVVLESYSDCENNADVMLYVVEGGGHTWPGSDYEIDALGPTTHSINASELIWTFFEAH